MGIHNTCSNCGKIGHLPKVCKSAKVNQLDDNRRLSSNNTLDEVEKSAYNVNIFKINTTKRVLPEYITKRKEYKSSVMVNNRLARVTADTGAKVSVCGTKQAKDWGLLSRMVASKTTLKPYQSAPIPVHGEARCSVTFGSSSVPVSWHIISGSCEPILSGAACEELGIIQFKKSPEPFHPIRMIASESLLKHYVKTASCVVWSQKNYDNNISEFWPIFC